MNAVQAVVVTSTGADGGNERVDGVDSYVVGHACEDRKQVVGGEGAVRSETEVGGGRGAVTDCDEVFENHFEVGRLYDQE